MWEKSSSPGRLPAAGIPAEKRPFGQFIHQTALSGNPKFFLKICIYVSDDIHDAFILPFKNGIVSAVHSNMNIFYFP